MNFQYVSEKFQTHQEGWLYLNENVFKIQTQEPSEIFENCKLFFGFGKYGYVTLQNRLDRLRVELFTEITKNSQEEFKASPFRRRFEEELNFLIANNSLDNLQRIINRTVNTFLPNLIYKVISAAKALFGYHTKFHEEKITKSEEYTLTKLDSSSTLIPHFEFAEINQNTGVRFSITHDLNTKAYVIALTDQDPDFIEMLCSRNDRTNSVEELEDMLLNSAEFQKAKEFITQCFPEQTQDLQTVN